MTYVKTAQYTKIQDEKIYKTKNINAPIINLNNTSGILFKNICTPSIDTIKSIMVDKQADIANV